MQNTMLGAQKHARPSPHSSHGHSHRTSSNKSEPSPINHGSNRGSSSAGQAPPPSGTGLRSPAVQSGSRTPSPNYFGLAIDPGSDPRDSAAGPKANWSPPTSSVRSFHGGTPQHIPVEANPEFELFRRQTEGGSTGFSLGHGSSLARFASTPLVRSTKAAKHDVHELSPKTSQRAKQPTPMEVDGGNVDVPGRMDPPSFFDAPRQESPMMMPQQRTQLSRLDDRHPRLSLPHNKIDPPSPQASLEHRHSQHRAGTLPLNLEDSSEFLATNELKKLLDSVAPEDLLLLDLRVYPQYSQSRIRGALNLCIPTTLLKRPSFNLQKLEDTFTAKEEKSRFARWRSAKYIIVYDASSVEKKDAVSAMNTLKKFTTEGWKGRAHIVRGGFNAMAKEFPKLIDGRSTQEMQSSTVKLSLGSTVPEVAPVAGGCMMPASKNPTMPFFSNIRQNQDLIGGVGQMDVQMPEDMDRRVRNHLPAWLRDVSAEENHGKDISDKFLNLELDEKSRMTQALSCSVQYGTPHAGPQDITIAGIEKGAKNRYNNIWPFEHTRVKLQGRPQGACDYINANHIKATKSKKRYIASQGPLPATFEDFWTLIWDQDVRVIVMLTAESEGGQLKCHPYWASKEFGPLKLKALSEKKVAIEHPYQRTASGSVTSTVATRPRANTSDSPLSMPVKSTGTPLSSGTGSEIPHVLLRKFTLSHAAHPFQPMREITQIQYSSWPDFGAPAKPSQLLGLVELGDALQRAAGERSKEDGEERPVLVHCSAGCGRTGTYCTVDSVIDMLKQQRKHKSRHRASSPMDIDVSAQKHKPSFKSKDSTSLPKIGGLSTAVDAPSPPGVGHTTDESSGQDAPAWLSDYDLDLVNSTVEDFRGQRISMVQSLRQFVLCYETVLEWCAKEERRGEKKRLSDRGAGIRSVSGSLLTAALGAVRDVSGSGTPPEHS